MEEMSITKINPYVRYVARADFTPIMRAVRAYDHRIFYMLDGECNIAINDRRHKLTADSMAVIRPGDAYTFELSGKWEIVDINFDYTYEACHIDYGVHPSFAEEFDESKMFKRQKFSDCPQLCESIVIDEIGGLRDEFLKIAEEFEMRKIFYREKSSAALKDIICDTVRFFTAEKVGVCGKLDEVLNYIKNNYKKNLSNSEIAERVGYHSYYLNRLIKLYTGTTLRQYLINCRLDAAKKLLRATEMSVEEIAAECGFKNLTHFSDSFKNKTGTTAAEYRKSKLI